MSLSARQQQLMSVWEQRRIPVIRRREGENLRVRLPPRPREAIVTNRSWLQSLGRRHPIWNEEKYWWEVPRSWLKPLIEKCLHDYGKVYIIQPYREQEKCAPSCRAATGYICQCSCMGEHHGEGDVGRAWLDVSETFSTRWGPEEIACRLLSR